MTKEVQLAGFENLTDNIRDQVKSHAARFLDKYSRMFDEETLKIFKLVADKKRERKEHILFEIKGSLQTIHGSFYAVHSDWEALDAVDKVIGELERQLKERKEKQEF